MYTNIQNVQKNRMYRKKVWLLSKHLFKKLRERMHPQYDNQGIHNFLLKCYTIMVNTQVQRLAFSLEKLRKMYKIFIISYNGILYDIPYDIKNFYPL